MGIRTLIVMSPYGLPYFSGNYICPNGNNCDVFSKDSIVKTDPTLVSGFFSALMNMVQMSGGELQQVTFEKFQYLAKGTPKITMVMAIDKSDNILEYQNRIQLGVELFQDQFGEIIDNWKGNVALFNAFQSILEDNDFFDEKPKYRKNCIECEVNQDCTFRMVTGVQNLELSQKMAKYPKRAIIVKIKAMIKEYMKYRKQFKSYKEFKKQVSLEKQKDPNFKIVSFIQS